MPEKGWLYFALGVTTVISIGAVTNQILPLAPATGLELNDSGITFPDGTVQTTAASSSKFINLNVVADANAFTAAEAYGATPYLASSVLLPPDYTPGTPLSLRAVLITDTDPCFLRVSANYSHAFRDGLGDLNDDGGSAAEMISPTEIEVAFGTTEGSAARLVEFTVDQPGTLPLQPGDGITLGLYFNGASSTCTLSSSYVHAAMLYYS